MLCSRLPSCVGSGALVAQQVCEKISDDRVFIGEARTAGQFGGSWFLFNCFGQGSLPESIFENMGFMRASNIRGVPLYLGGI
jgi:hypothetical protein